MGLIVNPNFKNNSEFHKNLIIKGKGNKDYPNSHTEVEYLGNGKFAASIGVGHRVFFDKIDGDKPKKHKLTDERPAKDYVLVQSAKCCVEIYPYYAKFFDIQHEEIKLHEERWVVQRLFKAPDKWKDVDAYNPVISVEEYSEPAGDVVKVTITYDTDYGELVVEYFQRDGNALKHNVTFKNTSGSTKTFRVLQKWAGIVGSKCNGEDIPVLKDTPYLAFHNSNKSKKKFNIAENLYSMIFNPDGSEKTDQCLQRPINIETHANGMKVDFIYGNWILAQGESLEIDPATSTLDNPTVDGSVKSPNYNYPDEDYLFTGLDGGSMEYLSYVEWDISGISSEATISNTVFKYHGKENSCDCHIHEMKGYQPSLGDGASIFTEAKEGTIYADPAGFPVVATNQEVDLGASADSDLQSQLSVGWFAIGINTDWCSENTWGDIYAEEYAEATPKPTLYVEYTAGVTHQLISTAVVAVSTVSVLSRGITEVLSSTVNIASSITGSLSRGIKGILISTSNVATSISGNLSRGIKEVLNSIANISTSTVSVLSRGITQALASTANMAVSITANLTKEVIALISTAVITSSITSSLSRGVKEALTSTSSITSSITGRLTKIINLASASTIVTSITSVLGRGITEALVSTSNITTSITSSISRGVKEYLNSTSNIVSSTTGSLSRGLKEALLSTSNIVTSVTTVLSRGITEVLNSTSTITTSLTGRLTRIVDLISTSAITSSIVSALSRGVTEALSSTSVITTSIIGKLTRIVNLISTSAIVTSTTSILSRGIKAVLSSTVNITTSTVSILSRGAKEALASTANIVSSIIANLTAIYQWTKVTKEGSDFQEVTKETSDWSKVEKGESNWNKTRKV